MSPQSLAYGEDLAFVHDQGFATFAQSSAPQLLRMFQDAGLRSGTVVDLGCGSGIWAGQLHQAGYRAIGIDQSAAFLDLARRRVPEAEFYQSSFVDVAFPPCVAVTALGEVFGYLFDERNDMDCDDNDLIDSALQALGDHGCMLGNWQGPTETALYFYGASSDEMERQLADLRASHPLCNKSRLAKIA